MKQPDSKFNLIQALFGFFYPILAQRYISYRNQSLHLPCKSVDWCLHGMQHWGQNGLNIDIFKNLLIGNISPKTALYRCFYKKVF